jgi:SAM-dependent methyltransferase
MENTLYNIIGENYNSTRQADPLIADTIYKKVITNPDGLYMDIGCGTGNYSIALANKGVKVFGIDPSQKMLDTAHDKAPEIKWVQGKAEDLPIIDEFIDGAFGTLTLHHWEDLAKGFSELYRTLKKGGKVTFFTSTPEQMEGYWLNHYFPEMLASSIAKMPSLENIEAAAVNAGFKTLSTEKYFVSVSDTLKDHFLYVGKNKPELYFNKDVRRGISSFAALSNADEVNNGLERLKADIENKNFASVVKRYENNNGDYLFVTFIKP